MCDQKHTTLAGCGNLHIANGEVHFPNGTDYGAVANITCSDGYDLSGKNQVLCSNDGKWEESAGFCVIKGKPACQFLYKLLGRFEYYRTYDVFVSRKCCFSIIMMDYMISFNSYIDRKLNTSFPILKLAINICFVTNCLLDAW